MESRNVVVLLTAAINVRGVANTATPDPAVRIREYQEALALWAGNPAVKRVVFCENTGADLDPFKAVWKTLSKGVDKEVEFLSFVASGIDPAKAKGLGEMAIIAHAVEHSTFIRASSHMIKVTGRYKVNNPEVLIDQVSIDSAADIVCGFRHKLSLADSRVFAVRPRFVSEFLLPMTDLIDDRELWFEHAFARAIHAALAQGWRWDLPADWIDLEGVAGTLGTRMRQPLLRRYLSRFMHRLRQIGYER